MWEYGANLLLALQACNYRIPDRQSSGLLNLSSVFESPLMAGQMSSTEAAESFLMAITSQHQSPTSTSGTQRDQPAGEADNFDTAALHGLKVLSCHRGRVVCSFLVTRPKTNRYRTLHGGCMGTSSEVWHEHYMSASIF